MIARLWHGMVPTTKAGTYHKILLDTGLTDYQRIAGNKAVFLLKKEENEVTHFYTLTFWDDIEAIKNFAGNEPLKAKYYEEDKDYLLEFEPEVQHFDVLEHPSWFK